MTKKNSLISYGFLSLSLATSFISFNGCSAPQKVQAKVQKPKAGPTLPEHYSSLKYPELSYQPPKPADYRTELAPGIVAYIIPDSSLPRIQFSAYFSEAGYTVDSTQLAANSLYSGQLIRGGGAGLSADKVADTLEFASAYLSGSTGMEYSQVDLDVMSKDFDTYLPLLQKLILEPSFDSLQIELAKSRALQNIKHKYDHPANLAEDLFSYVMYGTHPYFWSLRANEISSITQADLTEQAKRYFKSDTLYIGITGDFNPDSIQAKLLDWAKAWPLENTVQPEVKAPEVVAQPGVYIIDKETEQTQIFLGQKFLQRPNPDYYPATLASYILGGGGFTSRLVNEVRTKKGLAYSVYSRVSSNYQYDGTAKIGLQTKAPSTLEALDIIKREINRLIAEGPTDDEVAKAKEGLISSIPSIFKKPSATLDAFLTNELYKRPLDHFDRYAPAIQAITKEQIWEMYRKYFDPAKMSIVLVGPKEKIESASDSLKLADFGKVTEIKIEDLEKRQ